MQVLLEITCLLCSSVQNLTFWSLIVIKDRLCDILFGSVSSAWSAYRSVATWVARFGGKRANQCTWAWLRSSVCTWPRIVYLYTVHNTLRHAHAQQVNWEGWRPKHSWWVSCGGRKGHRWTRNQRGRMEVRGEGWWGEMGKRWSGWRKDEEGRRQSMSLIWDDRGKGFFSFLLSCLHFAGPECSFICMNAASLLMPSLSPSRCLRCHSAHFVEPALETDSSFLLKPSALGGLRLWRFDGQLTLLFQWMLQRINTLNDRRWI